MAPVQPYDPKQYPTPTKLNGDDVARIWAHLKQWFIEPRPGRNTRLETLSIAKIQAAAGVSNALSRYLSGGQYRGKPASPPAASHLGPLVSLLALDYGLTLPAVYQYDFPVTFCTLQNSL